MPSSQTIVDLRKLLAERFPQACPAMSERGPGKVLRTGIPGFDAALGGGLPRGEFTELVACGSGSGSAEVIHELLREAALNRQFLALVDGHGSFDPAAAASDVLSRLLWVRCQGVAEALKATDLLLRDRNFQWVILDLKLGSARELRGISSSVWHRYGRLLEQNQSAALVITPWDLVSGVACRVQIDSGLGIDALGQPRAAVLSRLRFRLARSAVSQAPAGLESVG